MSAIYMTIALIVVIAFFLYKKRAKRNYNADFANWILDKSVDEKLLPKSKHRKRNFYNKKRRAGRKK